jgi:hypothetical protein
MLRDSGCLTVDWLLTQKRKEGVAGKVPGLAGFS